MATISLFLLLILAIFFLIIWRRNPTSINALIAFIYILAVVFRIGTDFEMYIGMSLSVIGICLNGLVIVANNGYMPSPHTEKTHGIWSKEAKKLIWLGDIFSSSKILPGIRHFSIGDIFLVGGVISWIIEGVTL